MVYIRGKTAFDAREGSRAQVMHGTTYCTTGGLTKTDLKYNKNGRIVSRRKSADGQKTLKRLTKAGFKPFAKGRVGVVRRA